ncbi:plasmid partitioning protein RepB C-terminal domain-containing protein [Nitratidesulfovibrio sp. 1201_IL3209]|uniref:plasmid partitioning protein RepB C-terminal domain-containing protein n=1 Tax=Nitratidesulfovibrio sp. 1201_IL3209 TaxID=3084053 RepID=UPI002FDAF005
MSAAIKQGFERKLATLPIADLRLTKTLSTHVKQGRKYSQILSSIREVGLIEPPVVALCSQGSEYILLDGHLRILALEELGEKDVNCLVSVDNEGYTYNKFINRLSAVQEHKMIVKALNSGVSEEKLAASLSLDIKSIRHKKGLLDGVCKEAVDLLKDKIMSENVFRVLKKMKPMRQIKVAMLMNDQNRYSDVYARVLLEGTPANQLVADAKKKKLSPAAVEKRIRLEEESIALGEDIRALNDSYGRDMLNLDIIRSYLKRMLSNQNIAGYLKKHHPEIHDKFSEISGMDFFTMKNTS